MRKHQNPTAQDLAGSVVLSLGHVRALIGMGTSAEQLCDPDGRGPCGDGGSITVAREVPLQEGERTDSWEPGVAPRHCEGSCGTGGSITGAREVPLHGVEHTLEWSSPRQN